MNTTTLFSRAVQLMESGYSIMPVGLDKRPLLKSWKKYQTEPATLEELEAWWEQFPNANIGVITGKVSGITVIDIDTYKGGDASKFPKTFTVRTGNGGLHLYYAYQKGFTVSASAYENMPGVDIRSDGGYVVGPYSKTNYTDKHTHEHMGGAYTIIDARELAPFPVHLFPSHKQRVPLTSKVGASTGKRNDSIASFAGQLLQSARAEVWETEVWPAIERVNKTYAPPLPANELRRTYESIRDKEEKRRASLILSPLSPSGDEVSIAIRRNKSGTTYKDMANVFLVLTQHPFYKGTLRYNTFRQETEYNGRPIEEDDIFKIQRFMQVDADLQGISKEAVYAAVHHCAHENQYDEAQDWLKALSWDGTRRLPTWLTSSLQVEDSPYHRGIGAQWFMGMIRRIMEPGCTFDYVLLLVGKQGIGKTSFFRLIGGPWYKSYTGALDNKDFYLALRGAAIVDLDEGAALYQSEAIKIKSIITETHDEYRAPYDRLMKKYPRRFVFSMSTNDTEPFRDSTGNRRYWAVQSNEPVNFEWIAQNREQLFAEAYHYYKTNETLPEVPFDIAAQTQEDYLPQDVWTDRMSAILRKQEEYCRGDVDFSITLPELYMQMFPDANLERVTKRDEMRLSTMLKRAGFEKRRVMIERERSMRWYLLPERAAELALNNAQSTRLPMEDEFGV